MKKVSLFLVLCFCSVLFCGCTYIALGGTTDWGVSNENSVHPTEITTNGTNNEFCTDGFFRVDETSEDGLSGKISLTYSGSEEVQTYSYEFRNDTLVFMDDGEDVYVFTNGHKGLLRGIWTLEQPSGTTLWLLEFGSVSIYVKRGGECPDL
ncbi:MAG: hypothetical protein MJZ22_04265 [Candidatus Saccharibacteria bacterium]|nr:hypothetical protein [Candidatus Saccharibacteria bacterium]